MRIRLPAMLGVLFLALGFDPSVLSAGCGECEQAYQYPFYAYELCLAGCPVSDPNCEQIDCVQMGDECWDMGLSCGGWTLDAPIVPPSGYAFSPGSVSPSEPEVESVVFVSEDGVTVDRLRCNAVILDRTYPESVAADLREGSRRVLL